MQRRTHSSDEGWLLSYADLITNLLIFFAMLLAAAAAIEGFELARRLARRGVEVDVFTRATTSRLDPVVQLADGVQVRHVVEAVQHQALRRGRQFGGQA